MKMQRVQNTVVKGSTNVALIADLVLKSSEDKDNIDTTALLDKLWKLTEDSLCCLIRISQLGIVSETPGGIQASNF